MFSGTQCRHSGVPEDNLGHVCPSMRRHSRAGRTPARGAELAPGAPTSAPPLASVLFCPGTTRLQEFCRGFQSDPKVLYLVIKWKTELIQLCVKSSCCSTCRLYAAEGAVTAAGTACEQEPCSKEGFRERCPRHGAVGRSQRLLLPCSG